MGFELIFFFNTESRCDSTSMHLPSIGTIFFKVEIPKEIYFESGNFFFFFHGQQSIVESYTNAVIIWEKKTHFTQKRI